MKNKKYKIVKNLKKCRLTDEEVSYILKTSTFRNETGALLHLVYFLDLLKLVFFLFKPSHRIYSVAIVSLTLERIPLIYTKLW